MPELPEVETLRRELVSKVKNKTIKSATIKWPKMVKPLSPATFRQKIKGQKITDIKREAKVLILKLPKDRYLIIHLKMTGQLIYQPKKGKVVVGGHPQKGGMENLPNKFTHIILEFTDGSVLYFNDLRKFGWMRLVDRSQVDKLLREFGVGPLKKEFTLKKFEEVLKKYPNRKIKQVLTDQSLIAGIGNIYADESCFCSKIKPMRIGKTLNEKEIRGLYRCIPKILKFAISKKGTSADTYVQLDGSQGKMIKYLKVYNKGGQKCQRCGSLIKKIKQNGRGTHFCPNCQK